ncbi:MAG: hypothetical protein NVS9B5_35450 [Terriglobales bacterium]
MIRLDKAWSTIATVAIFASTISFASSAAAQGIHTSLRANADPYKAYQSYAGVWGDGNYAYIGSERRNGVLIYDISNPDAPILASYYAPSNSPDMEDIKVANGIGYFASNLGGGLHIVDVSNPANPQLLSRISSANGGYDSVHKVVVWQNFVFIPNNGKSPAILVFDVSNPSNPIFFTTIMSTDSKWVNDMDIQSNGAGSVRLYTAGWGGKCDIWDITNIASNAPTLLGSFSANIDGSSASATADGNFLAYSRKTIDGNSEVTIYNISNPKSVTVASVITMPAFGLSAVAPHDPKILGNLLYISWFQAGVVIFNITDPTNPVLVGSYDTWPGAVNATQLDGDWGVYPYLGQDRVLLSDRNTGLYVVDATGVSSQAALYNFKINPASVVGPVTSIGTVYLVGIAGAAGVNATLSSANSVAAVPASVTIAAGSHSASVTVATSAVATKTTAKLTALALGAAASNVLTVTPEIPSSMTFKPGSIIGGLSTTCTVMMAGPAPVDTSVTLAVVSGGSTVASMPATINVLAGSSSASFTVSTNVVSASTAVKLSATANGTSVTGSFTAVVNVPKTISFSPTSVIGGANITGTVTLAGIAPADTQVTLNVISGNAAIASIPSSFTIPPNSSSGKFTVTTNHVVASTAVQISATANGGMKTATVTVNP